MSPDLSAAIARLRRSQPRNPDTMAVCDAAEHLLRLAKAQIAVSFDRTEYQRQYMRDMRAARKAGMSTADYRNQRSQS